MSNRCFVAAIAIATGLVCAQSARAADPPERTVIDRDARHDPDLPREVPVGVDKNEYIRRRNEMINLLRGMPSALPYNARLQALREMEPARSQTRLRSLSLGSSSSRWTSIGPAPIPNGQTAGVTMPVSGLVSAIAVHPTNPDIAYAGTPGGGLYRTLDGGNTWKALLDDAMSLSVGAIAIDPANPSTVYVGTGEENSGLFAGVGVYRITSAETAATIEGPLGSDVFAMRAITKIVVLPQFDMLFVTTAILAPGGCLMDADGLSCVGVFRSSNIHDASPLFTRVFGHGFGVRDMVFDPTNHNNLICSVYGEASGGNGGIYVSHDALAPSPSFTRTLTFEPSSDGELTTAKLAVSGPSTKIYAATSEAGSCYPNGGRLHVSLDGGMTWMLLPSADGFCGDQCNYDIAVAVSPFNPNVIYLGGQAVFSCSHILIRSLNGGFDFAPAEEGLHADVHAIAVAPSNPNIVYFGSDGGIWRSVTAGSTWTSLNNTGFNATMFESLATHPIDTEFTIGGTQDNGTLLRDGAGGWFRADSGDGGYALIDQNATDTTSVRMYHTYFNAPGFIGVATTASVLNAKDNGWTFFGCSNQVQNGINCSDNVLFYAPMALGPGNPNTLYFGTERLYRSDNAGRTMVPVSQTSGPLRSAISAIGISPQNDGVRLIGTATGQLFATADGSATLTDVTPAGMPHSFVARAVIDPRDSNTAYITLAGYVAPHIWKTTNLSGGPTTWFPLTQFRYNIPVVAFAIDPADSNNLFAGYDGGIWRSQDGGATWSDFNEGLPKVPVFDLTLHAKSRVLRVATYGRGMWQRTVCQSITLGLDALAHGTFGQPYSQNLSVAGAIGSVRFSSSGTLPPGLILSEDGRISGTPASGGTFSSPAIATDANGCTGTRFYSIVINPAPSATRISADPSTYGSPLTLLATISSGATGTVQFTDGTAYIGVASVNSLGQATFVTPMLGAGTHTITASYSGDANFAPSTASTLLTVAKALLTITPRDGQRLYGEENPSLFPSLSGLKNKDGVTSSCDTTATHASDAGIYPITCSVTFLVPTALANYDVVSKTGSLSILPANQTLSWSIPTPMVYGTPLSMTQLSAAVSVIGPSAAGAVSYAPPAGTILEAGDQTLTATAAATTNYNTATITTTLTVLKATASLDNLTAATIAKGTETVAAGGHISYGTLAPPSGETISFSLNGTTQLAAIGADGNFSSSFATASLPVSMTPYVISYAYSGDRNFNPASGTGSVAVAYIDGLQATVTLPGSDDENGQSFSARVKGTGSGNLPGLFSAFLDFTPPSSGPNVRNVITGGRWTLNASNQHGVLGGRVISGVVQWSADGTKATVDFQFTVDGGNSQSPAGSGSGELRNGIWEVKPAPGNASPSHMAASLTGELRLIF